MLDKIESIGVQGSDDEDERGLDQFEEMEGDLDDIDEDKERDKVSKIDLFFQPFLSLSLKLF